MKKIIPILILILGLTITIIFVFFRPNFSEIFGEEIKEEEDEISIVNINDKIRKTIDGLSEKDWDKKYYYDTKSYIEAFYHKKGKEGTSEEDIALHELDLVYMKVLNNETEIVVDNCFNEDDTLKSEVDIFYNKYESESNEIRKARSWFTTELDIYSYKKKVASLITKRYNKNSYNKLKNNINTLKNSSNYSKIKRCRELSSIIDNSLKDLSNFKRADEEYQEFEKKILNFGAGVSYTWMKPNRKYMKYKWYKKDIEKIDNLIREKQKIDDARVEDLKESNNIRNKTKRKEAINAINLKYDNQEKNRWNKLKQKQMR